MSAHDLRVTSGSFLKMIASRLAHRPFNEVVRPFNQPIYNLPLLQKKHFPIYMLFINHYRNKIVND